MKTTEKLGLSLPEGSDYVNIETLNENFKRLDALSAKDIGLGNVPNVKTNDQTPTYTEASALAALSSGEKISTAFGKITKAISALIAHLGANRNPHNTTAADINAVSKSGDTMLGDFNIEKIFPKVKLRNTKNGRTGIVNMGDDKTTSLFNETDENNRQGIYINPETVSLENAFKLHRIVDGVPNNYAFLHTGNLDVLGSARIATGSYAGTGTHGSANKNSLSFGFQPKLVAISGGDSFTKGSLAVRGGNFVIFSGTASRVITSTWEGNTVSWYSTESADQQNNITDVTYHYVAIG